MVNRELYKKVVAESLNNKPKEKDTIFEGIDNSLSKMKDVPVNNPVKDEINLWTFWQGRNHKNVKVMLVGQDWGNPCINDNEAVMSNIFNDRPYFSGNAKPYPTDISLEVLFNETEYKDIISNDYDELFFTNFYPHYRKRDKQTGSVSKGRMRDCRENFKHLVEAINPKVIICLGKNTFDNVALALGVDGFTPAKNIIEYCNNLNEGGNIEKVNDITIFGMVHCGASGVNINRFRYDEKHPPKGLVINEKIDLMRYDWKKVDGCLRKLR